MGFTETLSVKAVPPFDFHLSALIFADGDKQIGRYENGKFWQVIRLDTKLVLATIKSIGTVENPILSVELRSGDKITSEEKKKAESIVENLFSLDFNLKDFYDDIKNDKILARLTQKLFGLKSPITQSVFEALVDSIIEQQISLRVASVLERKLIKNWGDPLQLDGEVFYAYPTPKILSAAKQEELRNIGLSQRKAEYIQNVASLIAKGTLDLESIKTRSNSEEIIKELDSVRGIGVWTAELTIIRGTKMIEAFPADDLGLRRVIAHFYGNRKTISSNEARKIAESWGKWKGLVGYYLYIAETLNIEP